MVLLDNDPFLNALLNLLEKNKTIGTLNITFKHYPDESATAPGATTTTAPGSSKKGTENRCLVRASDGKRKVSTILHSKDLVSFQIQFGNILKAHMDSLKKQEKKKKKKSKQQKV